MFMVHTLRFYLTTFLLSIVLVGCAADQDNQQGMDDDPTNVDYNEGNRNEVTNEDDMDQNILNNGDNDNITEDDGNVGDDNDGRTRMDVADEAADRVTQLKEVRQANVLTTNNNAYVAVILENGQEDEPTEQIKSKIANKVKEVDPDIDNVNVSTNPDFGDRVREYADAVDRGDPVEGLFDQLNETIERMFPDAE
jgi:spore cortex protein